MFPTRRCALGLHPAIEYSYVHRMDFLHLVDAVVSSRVLFPLLVALNIALIAGAVLAPRVSARARASADAAGISPLWSPAAVIAQLLFISAAGFLGFNLAILVMAAFVMAQLCIGGLIVYRHRRSLWLPLPLVLLSLLWSVMLVGVLILIGLWSQMKH